MIPKYLKPFEATQKEIDVAKLLDTPIYVAWTIEYLHTINLEDFSLRYHYTYKDYKNKKYKVFERDGSLCEIPYE